MLHVHKPFSSSLCCLDHDWLWCIQMLKLSLTFRHPFFFFKWQIDVFNSIQELQDIKVESLESSKEKSKKGKHSSVRKAKEYMRYAFVGMKVAQLTEYVVIFFLFVTLYLMRFTGLIMSCRHLESIHLPICNKYVTSDNTQERLTLKTD